jgi:hypothetical protein
MFAGQKVTAGNTDQSVQTTLSTYGSLAAKGILVTSTTYTLTENETFVYVDPSTSNVCSGTPVACNTYSDSTTCGNHTGVGCSWFTGYSCSAASGTDSGTCTSQGAGCTWDSASCAGANNTDSATCTNQNSPYGGGCTWDTSTCPTQTSSAACSAITGCTPDNSGDCTVYNGNPQSTCESNAGCTWNGAACSSFTNTDLVILGAHGPQVLLIVIP